MGLEKVGPNQNGVGNKNQITGPTPHVHSVLISTSIVRLVPSKTFRLGDVVEFVQFLWSELIFPNRGRCLGLRNPSAKG